MRRDVFISYAGSDSETALEVCRHLESKGISCWMAPRDVRPGSDWADEILKAIECSRVLLAIVSPDYARSEHVLRERVFAEETGKPLLEFERASSRPAAGAVPEEMKALTAKLAVLLEAAEQKGIRRIMRKRRGFLIPMLIAGALLTCAAFLFLNGPFVPEYPDGMEFAAVPAGTFMMGSPAGERGRTAAEGPVREVTVGSFEIMTTEVTQGMWQAVMGEDQHELYERALKAAPGSPAPDLGRDLPVCFVSWNEACRFAERVGMLDTLHHYRLPSEAEWEYACRAGTPWPEQGMEIDDIAWHVGNSEGRLHPVGGKAPNAWGIHDMLGSVSEWCLDNWADGYHGAPPDGSARMEEGSVYRVWRGGGFINAALICRPAFRDRRREDFRQISRGFRLVRIPRRNQLRAPPYR